MVPPQKPTLFPEREKRSKRRLCITNGMDSVDKNTMQGTTEQQATYASTTIPAIPVATPSPAPQVQTMPNTITAPGIAMNDLLMKQQLQFQQQQMVAAASAQQYQQNQMMMHITKPTHASSNYYQQQ